MLNIYGAANKSCQPVALPDKRPKGTQTFHYTLAGVDLVCEMDYEAATGDGWNEPRESERAYLCEARLTDSNQEIADMLSDDQRAEIEEAFLTRDFQ